MPTTHYALQTWTALSQIIDPADISKPPRVVDRAMHYAMATILADGRYSGATIQTNRRIAYPGNGTVDGCAWSISSAMEDNGTAQASSTDTQIRDTANLTQADSYWVGAWVFAESGANNGEYRQVTAFSNATGTLTVGSAFTAAFAVGDNYRVTFLAIRPDTLTNSVVNYVFGRRVTYATQVWTTEANGVIEFYASTVSTKPAGEIYLGTITLDGTGAATALDNDPTSDVDTIYALDIRQLRGTSGITALAGGATTQFYITFADSLFPGAFTTFSIDNANFTIVMDEFWENDRFRVTATNTGAYSDSATLSWRRVCLIA